MRRAKAYLLVLMGVASVLLGGCSGSSKANMEEAAEQPAVVDYTCISNPESDKPVSYTHLDVYKRQVLRNFPRERKKLRKSF